MGECRKGGAATMNSKTIENTARAVIARGGDINAKGQQEVEERGDLHPYVDVRQNSRNPEIRPRISRTSHLPRNAAGLYVAPYGTARSVLDMIDSTSSFKPYFATCFLQTGLLNAMVSSIDSGSNWQSSVGLIQDRNDPLVVKGRSYNRRVAIMQTMWEAQAEKLAEQIQLLMPTNSGGDNPEDYQLLLALLYWLNEFDSLRYGVKPYAFVTLDEIGRDWVSASMVREHLGIEIADMPTDELGRLVVDKVHFFVLNTDPVGGVTEQWWTRVLGSGRVIHLPDARYSAALKAGAVYVTENGNAQRGEVVEFLTQATASTNFALSKGEAGGLFEVLQRSGIHFGAQPKMEMPGKGAAFDHPRNPWPVGHLYYKPWKQLGLPDPTLGQETPFTPVCDAKLLPELEGAQGNSQSKLRPASPNLLTDVDENIEWGS